MTLTERYRELMDGVQLSPESRQRILSAVTQPRTNRRSSLRGLCAAACLALVLGLSLNFNRQPQPQHTGRPNRVTSSSPAEPVHSVQELQEQVDFPVRTAEVLPFEPVQTEFLSFHGCLAQITYSDGTDTLIFRQTTGDQDCSPDPTPYPESTEIEVGGIPVTLRGNAAGAYLLATWAGDGLSASMKCSRELSPEQWSGIVAGVR